MLGRGRNKFLMLFVSFIFIGFIAAPCDKNGPEPEETPAPTETPQSTPEPSADCSGGCQGDTSPRPVQLDPTSGQMQDGYLVCVYVYELTDADCCNLNRLTISGGDPKPRNDQVSAERSGGSHPEPAQSTGQVNPGWNTVAGHLACSIEFGCGNGTYTVTLQLDDVDACPQTIYLEFRLL